MCGISVSAHVATAHGEEDAFKKRRLELEEVNSARGMCRIIVLGLVIQVGILFFWSQDLTHKIATLSFCPSIR